MWLTIEQVADLGITEQWTRKKIASGEWQSRDSGQRGRNGKPIREVAFDSLPSELQWRWRQRQQAAVQAEDDDSPAAPTMQPADALDSLTRALGNYPADVRERFIAEANRLNEMMNRYEAIDPKRTRNERGELTFVATIHALCAEATCTDEIILQREPSRRKRPSPFTLDGWLRKRKQVGLLAFVRAHAKAPARGDRRKAKISPEAAEWLNAHYRNYPTLSHLYAKLCAKAKQNRWQIPSQQWLYRQYKQLAPVVKAGAFGRDKDYTSRFKPFVPRTVADLDALQMVCGDHHVLDVHCWVESVRQLARLWLTAWQDVRTGLIWGYYLALIPSSFTIGCAYANGVRAFGAQPFSREDFQSYAYTDNGKDYKSHNITGQVEVHYKAARIDGGLQLLLTQRGVGLLNGTDVKQFFARAYNGREKPIERTFKDLAESIKNEFYRTGWCGRTTSDKPDSWRDLYAQHERAIKRGKLSPFPSDLEIRSYVADWIQKYNTGTHTRATLGGAKIVPLTEFNRLYTTRYEIKDSHLAMLLMKTTRGAVGKNGVKLFGATYWHDAMTEFKGAKDDNGDALRIEIRYSDDDYTTVWAFLPNGTICEATRLEASSILIPNKETHKAIAAMTKHERNVINEADLIRMSRLRGETIEERVARLVEVEQEPIEMPLAVNAEAHTPQARIQKISRFDNKKLRAATAFSVTPDQIANVEASTGIFDAPERGRVVEFDFDE